MPSGDGWDLHATLWYPLDGIYTKRYSLEVELASTVNPTNAVPQGGDQAIVNMADLGDGKFGVNLAKFDEFGDFHQLKYAEVSLDGAGQITQTGASVEFPGYGQPFIEKTKLGAPAYVPPDGLSHDQYWFVDVADERWLVVNDGDWDAQYSYIYKAPSDDIEGLNGQSEWTYEGYTNMRIWDIAVSNDIVLFTGINAAHGKTFVFGV